MEAEALGEQSKLTSGQASCVNCPLLLLIQKTPKGVRLPDPYNSEGPSRTSTAGPIYYASFILNHIHPPSFSLARAPRPS